MSESNKKKNSQSLKSVKNSSGVIASEIISSALVDLNIVRKSTLFYPLDHHQVKQNSQKACNQLKPIFDTTPKVNIGVAADTLIFRGKTLDSQNSIYRELALSLSSQGIIVLTLLKGLTADELAFFLATLSQKPNQLQTEGGIVSVLKQSGMQHIQVTLIDYDKFQITEESEITLDQADDSTSSHQNIWQDFATQLMDNSLGQPHHSIDPQNIARLLNEQPKKISVVLEQYKRLVNNYLKKDGKDQLSLENDETISGINCLLHELNPQIRYQFLNTTLKQVTQSAEVSKTQTFISKLSQNLVAEMLQQANQKNERISESLMHLIQRIAPTIDDNDEGSPPNDALCFSISQKDQFQELFKQEGYQNFVADEYDQTLRQLGKTSKKKRTLANSQTPFFQEGNSLEQPYLDQHIIRALKGMMDRCDSLDEYRDYSCKAIEIAQESLKKKNFGIAVEAIDMFNQHLKEKRSDKIIPVAKTALAQIIDSKVIDDLIQTLDQFDSKVPPIIGPLFEVIGPKIVPPLVQRFIQGGHGGKQHIFLRILKRYKKESVAAAHQLVRRNDIEQVKKMIFLIRKIDDRASSTYLRSLAAHTNPDVSEKALAALLYFNDSWGIFLLRDRLNSENPDEISKAITMAGDYRIKEIVTDLSKCLKFAALNKAEIKRNMDVVTAMGKIGDATAIPYLTKLLKNTWSLYRSNLRQLKVHVFSTLKGYPSNEIKPLLEIGPKIKNKAIDQICTQLSSFK
jgi:hypothetical protein